MIRTKGRRPTCSGSPRDHRVVPGGKSPSPGLPCPSPCSSRRSTSPPSRPGPAASPPTSTPSRAVPCRRQRSARRELVLVVAGDVVVRLVVTAHVVACHGEDPARDGDALRLVTTIQLWFLSHLLIVHRPGIRQSDTRAAARSVRVLHRAARRGESSRCGCRWARPKPRPIGGAHLSGSSCGHFDGGAVLLSS